MNNISKNKQKKIEQYINEPIKVNDLVYVLKKSLCNFYKDGVSLCKIISIDKEIINVRHDNETYKIKESDIKSKLTMYIGENPFDETIDSTRNVAFSLSSILSSLGIIDIERENYKINGIEVSRCNWNPYIYKNKKKFYYQRDFVWTIKDKQLLIESIYQNIDCGKILIRKRGWKELESMKNEKELSFNDIVDGKQRLEAIQSFINDKYKDLHGNHYSDLSEYAQRKFLEHQLFSYSEMPDNSKDEDVIKQFLKLNFTGVLQSEEHLEYVKSLKE